MEEVDKEVMEGFGVFCFGDERIFSCLLLGLVSDVVYNRCVFSYFLVDILEVM